MDFTLQHNLLVCILINIHMISQYGFQELLFLDDMLINPIHIEKQLFRQLMNSNSAFGPKSGEP